LTLYKHYDIDYISSLSKEMIIGGES